MKHRFIFVGGLHRSGTSILYRCLGDHPGVSPLAGTGMPEDEGQHVQSVFSPAHAHGGAARFGFDPAAHLTEASPLVTLDNRRRLQEEWSRYWDVEKPVLVEKSPPNLIRTRFLQAMFPDSFFVIIVRHPIAYAFPRGEANPPRMVHTLIRHWVTCHQIFRSDRPFLNNVVVLKYEDFVRDPEGNLTRIFAMVGLDYVPPVHEVKKDINRRYLEGWENARKGWLSGAWMKYITRRYEGRVQEMGYSLVDPDRVRSFDA